MIINDRVISSSHPPYMIAEISGNHNGSFDQAKALIKYAKTAGADAVKLQTYRPDTITLESDLPDFYINEGLWKGKTLYELYDWAHTPWDWHKPLFHHAKSLDITIFSSPFDSTAVDLLEDLEAPAYKVASFEITDLPLIAYIARTRKPMIISTGMANDEEIAEAVDTAKANGCKQLALLHCVSGYPAPSSDYNLATLLDLQRRFKTTVGLSDHSLDNTTAITATALGTQIIEKHFTLDRNNAGPDDSFSLEPDEFKILSSTCKAAYESLGAVNYTIKSSEKANLKFRRSLYFTVNLKPQTTITEDHIKSVRPGHGISPKYFDAVVGKKVNQAIQKNTPVLTSHFDQPL